MPLQPTSPSSGHRALRAGRRSVRGQAYLVTTTTHGRRPFFAEWTAAHAACAALHESAPRAGAKLLAWVLMPDHWHAIVTFDEDHTLSQVVNRLKSTSAIATNAALGRTGPVWARAFHDRAMRADEDLVAAARYVVGNPVRAGLCRRVGDYPYWNAVWVGEEP